MLTLKYKGGGTTVISRSSLAFAAFRGILLLCSGAHADHHKKNKDSDALTECTIESSGGFCTAGFKRVCQKLKNGNKCCGCVIMKESEAAFAVAIPKPSQLLLNAELQALLARARY